METILQIAQILGVILLIRYVFDTYRTVRANSYFTIMKEINGKENVDEMNKIKHLISEGDLSLTNISGWSEEALNLARNISNRYQIVAHLVERNFLSKAIFIENFSGTTLDAWNHTAAYIRKRRSEFNNSRYLRRDLERLAIQCFLYQLDLKFNTASVFVIPDNNEQNIIVITRSEIKVAKKWIRKLLREPLFFLWLKTVLRNYGIIK